MKTAKRERVPGVSVKNTKTPLTKTAMISEMQRQDAAAWLELKQAESRYGCEDEYVSNLRARWATINEVMNSLGIQSDHTLPDNLAATDIILRRIRV